jgi:hypothetical protein
VTPAQRCRSGDLIQRIDGIVEMLQAGDAESFTDADLANVTLALGACASFLADAYLREIGVKVD